MKHWDKEYLSVMVDMAGCPNRCRHCWLGCHKNGNMSAADFRDIAMLFKNWRDEKGGRIKEFSFFSWWREPDYRDDYRELWELEQTLSTEGRAERFELLSVWRLARDKNYAEWAAALKPKVCQITFFGTEENTDWGFRRKGAFSDNLLATERLLEVGMVPRFQLFITKRSIADLDNFLRLIDRLELHNRCRDIGQRFEVFIGGISPEGNGYGLEDIRVDEKDLALIPHGLIDICRDGVDLLGKPENLLLGELMRDNSPPNLTANFHSVSVTGNFDVYPNIAEPAKWWCLGNLKTDGTDAVIRAYRDGATLGMSANRTIPRSRLAKRYGDKASNKLYSKGDLISRFLHQWGVENAR